jgi:hypothetical protein
MGLERYVVDAVVLEGRSPAEEGDFRAGEVALPTAESTSSPAHTASTTWIGGWMAALAFSLRPVGTGRGLG